jgi:toxin ParE1/3/4
MASYRLRSLARDDLEAIWDYTVEQWDIKQAERYLDILFGCFDDLAANPQLGRPRDDVKSGYRSFPQGRHVVFYVIEPSGIEIIGIVHQRADVDRHLDVS